MGKLIKFLYVVISSAIGALFATFTPFGTFIVQAFKKVLGLGYAEHEADFFTVANDVFFHFFNRLFPSASGASTYLDVWNIFVERVRPWDQIFPVHEVLILIMLVAAYVLAKYSWKASFWCVKRIYEMMK